MESRPPAVPLQAGSGPDNPPCPACGQPLFGWASRRPDGAPIRRCERCGLGVAGEAVDRERLLAALRAGPVRLPNRASLQASIGSSGWAGIEPQRRFLLTPDALRRLGEPIERPRADVSRMWQTLMNSFTFGHNVGLGWIEKAEPSPAPRRWQRLVDAAISVLGMPVVLVAAALLEAVATLGGRGGTLIRARRAP